MTTAESTVAPLAISVPEAAELLGISRNLAYEMATAGSLPTIRMGRRLLVPVAKLHQLLGIQADTTTTDPSS